MTRQEAIADHKASWIDFCKGNKSARTDVVMFNEDWHNHIDRLHRSGEITDSQAENWDNYPIPKRYKD